ncbi:hypothetical protein [Comamonas sp.]|uniref:hypothetical protein n=1 Tax=Comamonas sp. TaxID=34028 RepID=UPI003A8E1920
MTDPTQQTAAHKLLYILVVEQGLRAGEVMAPQFLAQDLDRHGMSHGDQQAALALAISQGWLQTGAEGEIQLTEEGFALDFAQ